MHLAPRFGSDVPHVISHPVFGSAQVTPESIDYMSREARLVERNEGLILMSKPTQMEDLNGRLFIARFNLDHGSVKRIGTCITKKKANSTRKNKRKRENKMRNKSMRHEYDAALTAQISDVDDDDYDNDEIVPNGVGGSPPRVGCVGVTVQSK